MGRFPLVRYAMCGGFCAVPFVRLAGGRAGIRRGPANVILELEYAISVS
jgi:hypothetical protein